MVWELLLSYPDPVKNQHIWGGLLEEEGIPQFLYYVHAFQFTGSQMKRKQFVSGITGKKNAKSRKSKWDYCYEYIYLFRRIIDLP